MKKIKLLVGTILTSLALSGCSFLSMFTPNNDKSTTGDEGDNNTSEMLEGAKQVDLFFNEDKTVVEAFATAAEVSVNKLNSAEAIKENTKVKDSSIRVKGSFVTDVYSEEDDDYVPLTLTADVGVTGASMDLESVVANMYGEKREDIFGYVDATKINGTLAGNYEIQDNASRIPESVNKKGNFSYKLENGAFHTVFQDEEAFIDGSDTNLVNFANSIISDKTLVDINKLAEENQVPIETPITIGTLLDRMGYATKFRTGPLSSEIDNIEGQVEEGFDYQPQEGIVPFGKEEIVQFFDYLLSDEMKEQRQVAENIIKCLNLKTFIYPAKNELAYSLSISIPNFASLKEIANIFIDYAKTMKDQLDEDAYESAEFLEELEEIESFEQGLDDIGVSIQNFKAEIVLALRKDGGFDQSSNLTIDASMDSTKSKLFAREEEVGVPTINCEFHLKSDTSSSTRYVGIKDVESHKLNDEQKAGYILRCYHHDYQSQKIEIDSCHTEYKDVCSVCGYVLHDEIYDNHAYTYIYDERNSVMSEMCSKCNKTNTYQVIDYNKAATDGQLDLTLARKTFIKFTAQEEGPYTFIQKGTNRLLWGGLNSDLVPSYTTKNEALFVNLDAGQTFFMQVDPGNRDNGTYHISYLFNECYKDSHVGEYVTEEKVIDPCHTNIITKCSACGKEIYSYVREHHTVDYENPIVKEINQCTTEYSYVCSVCHEVVGTGTESNHEYETSVEKVDDTHYIKVTYCPICGDRETEEMNINGALENSPTEIDLKDGEVYLAFTPKTSGTYYFTSSGHTDVFATLYDANFDEIAYDDDSGEEMNFRLSCELEANKTYFLYVRTYGERNTTCSITFGLE